jgi:tol-pal system protein YbgF
MLLCSALAPGCLTSTQATRIQTDLDEVKRQVFQVQQETAGTQQRLEAIDRKLADDSTSSTHQADLNASMQSLLDQIQILTEQIQQMETRMAGLQMEIQSLRAGDSTTAYPAYPVAGSPARAPHERTTGPPSASGASDPVGGSPGGTMIPMPAPSLSGGAAAVGAGSETFNTAYADYSKGNYELAVMGFTDFLRSHPEHLLAPDAQYWIGECLYSQGKFSDAAEAFDRTVGRYPTCEKVPAALLKKGLAQMELGQTSRAVTTLQRLIETRPDSEEARLAAERLSQLGLRSP